MPANGLANQSPFPGRWLPLASMRVNVSECGAQFLEGAAFLLVSQQAERLAHDFAGVAKLTGLDLARHELFPSCRQRNVHDGKLGGCH